ncbi:MAG: LptF/LptG family permease, partial [Alphaproteobacteria bacterium]
MIFGLVDRHLLRQLVLHLFVIAPGTVAIVWLIQALRLVEVSLERGWSALTVLWLLFLLVWRFVDILLPFAVFVSVVAVLLSLEDTREIEAAQALGLGLRRLMRSILLFGVMFGLLVWVNALVVAPLAFSQFLELREDRGRELAALFLRPGNFREITPGVTLWMRSVDEAGDLHDLVIYDMRDSEEVSVLHARRGRLVESSRGYRLLLVDGSRHRVDRLSVGSVAGVEAPSVYWVSFGRHELLLEDPVVRVRRLHRIEMSLAGLFDAARLAERVEAYGGAGGAGA